MGLLMSMVSAAGTVLRPPSTAIPDDAESEAEQDLIMQYVLDPKLSRKEVLFQDVKGRSTPWKRNNFITLLGNFGMSKDMTDLYVDRINESTLMVHGHFKKFVFRTSLAKIVVQEADSTTGDIACLLRVREHLSSIHYLAEGKIDDANKCELWCIPLTHQKHATAIVVNMKEACFEYLDSGPADGRKTFRGVKVLCDKVTKLVTMYIDSMVRAEDRTDFSEFEWTIPRVPRQPSGSKACAIYRLRFLEGWNGGSDLCRFEGWDEESWHGKERAKICASILTGDSNAVLGEVKRKARKRREMLRSIKERKSIRTTSKDACCYHYDVIFGLAFYYFVYQIFREFGGVRIS